MFRELLEKASNTIMRGLVYLDVGIFKSKNLNIAQNGSKLSRNDQIPEV